MDQDEDEDDDDDDDDGDSQGHCCRYILGLVVLWWWFLHQPTPQALSDPSILVELGLWSAAPEGRAAQDQGPMGDTTK